MNGQLSLFDYADDMQGYHYCCQCEKAKYKERTRSGIDVWFCGEMRAFINVHTTDWICKPGRGRSLFERNTSNVKSRV